MHGIYIYMYYAKVDVVLHDMVLINPGLDTDLHGKVLRNHRMQLVGPTEFRARF
jgi:hypothetical protein